MRKDDSGLEDELEYFWEAPIPSDSDEREEDKWWSPGPQEPSSEDDEEEVRYLTKLLRLEAKEDDVKERKSPSPDEDTPGLVGATIKPRWGNLLKKKGSQQKPRGAQRRPLRRGSGEGNSGKRW
jgi:hypothetical protein